MQRTQVKSSQIASIGYDAGSKVMEVEFIGRGGKPGGVYQYAGVDADTHANMMAAESHGKFLGSNIKGKFEYTRLPDQDEQK